MKINEEVYIDQEQVGNFQTVTSKISDANLAFALDAVSKNLYSNPIGAFIRELTSNAVDANKANNKERNKVEVKIFEEDDAWYFQVKDEGKGMSQEHFTNVYMSWFDSDKRNDNEQIGGWGIGSKSPLSYGQYYNVITINEGKKWEWQVVRQRPAPTATLLTVVDTDEPSGTTVIVELKEDDLVTVHHECVKQLAYFNNVVVLNEKYYYDNHFKIVETDLYRHTSASKPFSTMHICLGQVPYPINWDLLGIKPINMPVALMFNTGDIPVGLSREEINYFDEHINVKEILSRKISEAYNDLVKRFQDQMKTTNLGDFFKELKSPKSLLKLGDNYVNFNPGQGRKIPIPYLVNTYNGIAQDAYKRNYTTQLTEEFRIGKDDLNVLFLHYKKYEINKKKELQLQFKGISKETIDYPVPLLKKEAQSHWKDLYHSIEHPNKSVIEATKYNKTQLQEVAKIIGETFEKKCIEKWSIRPVKRDVLKLGALRKAYRLLKLVDKWVENNTYSYDYLPPDFIEEQKEEQKRLKEERKGVITYYTKENKSKQITLEELYKYDYVFYANKEWDETKLIAYHGLFERIPAYLQNKYIFIKVASSTYRKLKPKKDKFKTVKAIWNVQILKNEFIKIRLINELFLLGLSYHIMPSEYYKNLYRSVISTEGNPINFVTSLERYVTTSSGKVRKESYTVFINLYETFKEEIDKLGIGRHQRAEDNIKELKKVQLPLLLLQRLDLNSSSDKVLIKQIIKQYKVTKLNIKYYG